ncbi:MAG: FAD-dependent monooxygenase [Hahellaceae bacterium]|nr:FAD-dependent monooxygenase [Hahellaceae bacterium]MCP5170536.1 FAD-dependent monooxygenase [Hahellaceae bacterium]
MQTSNSKDTPDVDYDLVIVGGGMVGSAIACGLAHSGLKIAVLEQHQPMAFSASQLPDLRVSALSVASEQFLTRIGAWKHIQAMRLCPYRRMSVWEQHRNPLLSLLPPQLQCTAFDSKDIGHSHLGHIIENRITQLALLERAADFPNVTLITPATLQNLELAPNKAKLQIVDHQGASSTLSTKLVIGADGAQSRVRTWANIGLNSDQYGQQALVINVEYQGQQEDITWQAFTPSGPRAFLPLMDVDGKHYASLVWYDSPETIQHLQGLDAAMLKEEIARQFPATLPPLVQVLGKGSFSLVKRHAQRYVSPRVALVGDAAHTINPLAGQGVNLGFQDAIRLIETLENALRKGEDIGHLSALRPYEKTRRRENQFMMAVMDLFYHTFSNTSLPLQFLRNAGLGVANQLPLGKRKVMRYAMGLEPALPLPFHKPR